MGTDYLKIVVKNIRLELEKLGAEVRFPIGSRGILTENGRVVGAEIRSPEGQLYIQYRPPGACHRLQRPGYVPDAIRFRGAHGAKQFAMGVRIEQKQKDVTIAQFGAEIAGLPVATYKLSCHPETGRGRFRSACAPEDWWWRRRPSPGGCIPTA